MDSWDPEADRRRLECVHVGPAELRAGRPRPAPPAPPRRHPGPGPRREGRDHRGDRAGLRGPGLPGGHRGRRPRQGPRRPPPARTPLLLPAGGGRTPLVRPHHDGTLPVRPGPEPIHGAGLRDRHALGLRPQPDLRRARLRGELRFEGGEIEGMALDLTVRADSLELLDRVSAADRGRSRSRMRRDVLETAAYPEITYQAEASRPSRSPGAVSAPHRRPAVAARRHPAPAGRRGAAGLPGRHPS